MHTRRQFLGAISLPAAAAMSGMPVPQPLLRKDAASLAADLEQWLDRIGDPFLPTREQAAHFGIDYLHPRLHPDS